MSENERRCAVRRTEEIPSAVGSCRNVTNVGSACAPRLEMLRNSDDLMNLGSFSALKRKAQGLTRPRMIAIQQNFIAFDFEHIENMLAAIIGTTSELAAHLHARWKFGFGNGFQQPFVTLPKSIGR